LVEGPKATVVAYNDVVMLDARTDYGVCFQGQRDSHCTFHILPNANARLVAAMFACDHDDLHIDTEQDTVDSELYRDSLEELAGSLLGGESKRAPCKKVGKDKTFPKDTISFAIAIADATFKCSIPLETVHHYVTKSTRADKDKTSHALTPLQVAITGVKAQPTVVLDVVELTVADLVTLQVGDVIPLKRNIYKPNVFLKLENEILCQGMIGKRGNEKAIVVTEKI